MATRTTKPDAFEDFAATLAARIAERVAVNVPACSTYAAAIAESAAVALADARAELARACKSDAKSLDRD